MDEDDMDEVLTAIKEDELVVVVDVQLFSGHELIGAWQDVRAGADDKEQVLAMLLNMVDVIQKSERDWMKALVDEGTQQR